MRHFLLAAALLALVGCSGPDAADQPDASGEAAADLNAASRPGLAEAADGAAPPAAEYVAMAGAGDLYEIQSSRAVLETTQNADLRRFAEMMVEHHTETTQAVVTAAREAGMTPAPPALDPAKTAMIGELQAAQGTDRDAVYVRQQIMAHEDALALHRSYSNSGDETALRSAAAAAVPVVEGHLGEIRGIQSGPAH